MLITQAKSVDAQIISDLATHSKAHWGYGQQFMSQVKEELTYCVDDINQHPTFVATKDEVKIGFYQLVHVDELTVELDAMFVDPAFIGQGVGGKLFSHAVTQARQLGYTSLSLQADPNAASFYLKQGCVKVGEKPSLSIPGRVLPSMIFDLVNI